MAQKNKIKGFMCGVAYQFEIGPDGAFDGVHIYPSRKAIKHYKKCTGECGIVQFEMGNFKWVLNQRLFDTKNQKTVLESTDEQIADVTKAIEDKKAFLKRLKKERRQLLKEHQKKDGSRR